jgi:hypothetical protein
MKNSPLEVPGMSALHRSGLGRARNRAPRLRDVTTDFPIDHILARQHGALSIPENLALSCLHNNKQCALQVSPAMEIGEGRAITGIALARLGMSNVAQVRLSSCWEGSADGT